MITVFMGDHKRIKISDSLAVKKCIQTVFHFRFSGIHQHVHRVERLPYENAVTLADIDECDFGTGMKQTEKLKQQGTCRQKFTQIFPGEIIHCQDQIGSHADSQTAAFYRKQVHQDIKITA